MEWIGNVEPEAREEFVCGYAHFWIERVDIAWYKQSYFHT